jgi:ELWxxDGT repeat protein
MLYLSGFSSTNRRLVVIDDGLMDRDQLIAGVLPHTTVLVLDRQEDCLNRVREVLQQHDEIDSLHLVGHGEPGQISLGQNAFNASNLLFFADKVKAWADFLVSSSQILLYGCRTGAGIIGRRFVQDLARLTGAEVFASKSLVGGAALGGSWDLTVSAGADSAPSGVFTEAAQKAYRDVLATPRLVKVVDGLDLGILNGATGIGGELLFTANVGSELWISDGTDPGTVLIKNFPENIDFPPTNVNGIAYFARDDGNNGVELWKSDGTAAGTVLVSDINVGSDGSFPLKRVNVNGTLFFSAFDNTSGYELWNSNGGGAFLVKDIIVGDGSSGPHDLTNVNGRLFFVADDKAASEIDTVSPKLWISDGTDGGTTVVKDPTKDIINFSFLEGPIDPTKLIGVGNILFFEAGAFETGRELWRSDGTEGGTFLVQDITLGQENSDIQNLTNVNGTLFFTNAEVPDPTQATLNYDLWRSDGVGAFKVDTFPSVRAGGLVSLSPPSNFTAVNNTLFFTVDDGINGEELWKNDGGRSVLVKDITPGSGGSGPNNLVESNGTLFFVTNGRIWKSDGTELGTQVVADASAFSSAPTKLRNVGGTLYFTLSNSSNELWTLENDIPNPNPSILSFSAADYSISEVGTTTTPIKIVRSGGSSGEVSITVIPANGSATAPEDYNNVPIAVIFSDGDTTPKIVNIPISNDTLTETNETITITLKNPTGAASIGSQSSSTLTIVDDDNNTTITRRKPILILPGLAGSFVSPDNYDRWILNRGLNPDELVIDPLVHYYDDLISTLENTGYKLGEDLFVATYDWRLPPGPNDGSADGRISTISATSITDGNYEYGVDYLGYWLAKAAAKWKERFPNDNPLDSVDIVAHSTGGLVARTYIQSIAYGGSVGTAKLPKVDDLIMLGVPNQGAPIAWNPINDDWNSAPEYQFFLRQLANVPYQKLLDGQTINGPEPITEESIIAQSGNSDLNSKESKEAFIDQYAPTIKSLLATYDFGATVNPEQENSLLLDLNADISSVTSNSKVTVAYGYGLNTITSVKPQTGPLKIVDPPGDDFDQYAYSVESFTELRGHIPAINEQWWEEFKTEGGDGTVPVQSSTYIPGKKVVGFKDVEHGNLPSNQKVQEFILDTLEAKLEPGEQISTDKVGKNWETIEQVYTFIIDPVDGFLVDSQGRRLGYSKTTGAVTEIPNSFWYGGENGIGWIFGKLDFPATLQLTGLGQDYYVQVSGVEGAQAVGVESSGFLATGEQKSLDINVNDLQGGVNDEPSGADNTVTTAANTTYTFTAQDFNFSDPKDIPANNLLAVKITTLPLNGSLTNKGTIVNAGDFISATDITAGNLQFTPATDTKGLNYANLTFQVQDDGGTANGGIDLDQTPNTITIDVSSSGGSTGDPHILTFDNLHYDFQATGDFILVKAQDSDLEIQVRQAPWDQNPATTLNVGLATTVDGQQLEFSIKQPFPLLNGIPISIEPGETQALGNGSISRTPTDGYGTLGDLYTITYPNGDRLFANVYPNFLIDSTVHLKGSQTVTGLLGNNNGQIEDDLALQDGTISPQPATPEYLLSEFANGWQVQPENSLFRDRALPSNSKLVTGSAANDTLTGTENNDILFGTVATQLNPGTGEIDKLTGNQGADIFVLGSTQSTFYTGSGINDYALIQDFNPQDGDIIQLKGDVNDYVLGSALTQQGSGTGIFLASDPTELIGIVKGIEPQDLLLTQKSFQYI